MNKFKVVICFLMVVFLSMQIAGQVNLPTRKIGDTNYYYYKVGAKETIFGLTKKLNITQEDMVKYNPSISDGLKKDAVLFFPVELFDKKKEVKAPVTSVVTGKAFTHVVEKGETLYGISKIYNVSQESIIAVNPSTASGLKVGQVLSIPQPNNGITESAEKQTSNDSTDQPVVSNTGSSLVYHTIKKGDTLFSLSNLYNTTIEKILELNPGVSPSNFKLNDVIKISPNSKRTIEQEKKVMQFTSYEVKKGDTFFSIAKDNSITVEQLQAANPNLEKLKKGKYIQIPVVKTEKVLVKESEGSQAELADNDSPKITEIYNSVHQRQKANELNVGLVLPFMLGKEKLSKNDRLYTEFYKGFLMSVNEVRKKTNKKINVYAFDTEDSKSTLNTILEKPELKNMDLIFAPNDESQISLISAFGKNNNIGVVNSFSTRNEEYTTNPKMFQVNIPPSFFYAEALEWMKEEFKGSDLIYLNYTNDDAKDFGEHLKKQAQTSLGKQFHEIMYSNILSTDEISKVLEPGKKYLFIPSSASKKSLAYIIPALKKIKEERIDIDFSLFGYPEWIAYMSSYNDDFHRLDTYFYSRFFIDKDEKDVKSFNKAYKEWYNEDLIHATPSFGMLGYDLGKYMLGAVAKDKDFNKGVKYNGVQNSFNFERISNWSGFVNKSMYFVHLSPSGITEKIVK